MSEEKNKWDDHLKNTYSGIFRKYYPSLLFYATRFIDQEQAEDIVQDAFVELWERRDSIEMGEQIASFMYRSVYTKTINKLKHEAVVSKYGSALMDIYKAKMNFLSPDHNDILKKIENKEMKQEIFLVIEELPDRCKEVFKLSYLHSMKNKDIAEVLGISLRTVETHMYKALKLLRSKLSHLIFLFLLFVIK